MHNSSTVATAYNLTVPEMLKAHRQFVVWKLVQKPNQPKPTKIPFNPNTGGAASVSDPNTWADYNTACQAFWGGGYNGIGFVFTQNDPFVFLDLDNCRDTKTGDWMPHAQFMNNFLSSAAWEVSQSGNGLHAIVHVTDKKTLSHKMRKWSDRDGNLWECYTEGRFIAFGHCIWTRSDLPILDVAIVAAIVPDAQKDKDVVINWADSAEPDYCGSANDDELIQRAMVSKGGASVIFEKSAAFAPLWSRNEAELAKFYPDDSGKRPFDNSSAEMALANHLAWWTGRNPARIERLMSRSPLCQRDKWRDRADYRKRTIEQAVAHCKSYMCADSRRQQQIERDKQIGDNLGFPILTDVITLDDAIDNLVFVAGSSHVVDRRTKRVRQYNDIQREYGASRHPIETGKIDNNGKSVVRYFPVIKVWMDAPRRQSVDVLVWAPGEKEFCQALERTQAGERAYNLWAGLQYLTPPPNWQEWVQPFLDHLKYLIPIESERVRFLQWIAHIFQHPDELPHTCYLMITPTTGTGRGTLGSIITRALRGYVAVNINIDAYFNGFNGRAAQKLLATVDEVREGNSINKYEKQEMFKSRLTEEVRLINPKYGHQMLEKNCCRLLLFSNHYDAMPFDIGDRRVIVIANPTERRTPQEYKHLHDIMDKPEFIASVQNYLRTLDLTDFSAHEPAPLNAIKQRALKSLESDADAAARQFKEVWPGDFATVADLRIFIGDDAPKSSGAISHIIERAGMHSAHKQRINRKSETVLIVRGGLIADDLKNVSREKIASEITRARLQFDSS